MRKMKLVLVLVLEPRFEVGVVRCALCAREFPLLFLSTLPPFPISPF